MEFLFERKLVNLQDILCDTEDDNGAVDSERRQRGRCRVLP